MSHSRYQDRAYQNRSIVSNSHSRNRAEKAASFVKNTQIQKRSDDLKLAIALRERGAFKEALALLKNLLKNDPRNTILLHHVGRTFEKMGELAHAIATYKEALSIAPANEATLQNLGALYYRVGRYQEALALFEKIRLLKPNDHGIHTNIGSCLCKLERYEEAIEAHRKAIEREPHYAGAYTNLGNVYNRLNAYDQGAKLHRKAIELDPKGAYAYANLANSLKHLGAYEEAIELYQKAIKRDPNFINAYFDLATTYLALGRFKEGFALYEWRFRKQEMRAHIHTHRAIFSKPRLQAHTDAHGARVLVHTEQGFGDSIQFVRFVDQLKERFGCEVILQCRDELKTLFEHNIKNVDHFYARDSEPVPKFDYQIPLLSLPYLYEIEDERHIPYRHTPYIEAPRNETIKIKKEHDKIYIGINWSTSVTSQSHKERTFGIDWFAPLLDHEKIVIYSLQVGPPAKEIKRYGYEDKIVDMSDRLNDFSQTASLIEQLDLVITSDTAVAHLAGAMGKEVWIVLPKASDWRWGIARSDSYLYPNITLLRQEEFGVWEKPFRSIYERVQSRYHIQLKTEERPNE